MGGDLSPRRRYDGGLAGGRMRGREGCGKRTRAGGLATGAGCAGPAGQNLFFHIILSIGLSGCELYLAFVF